MRKLPILLVAICALLVLVTGLAALAVLSDRPTVVLARSGPEGERLILRSGDVDLPGLVAALNKQGQPGAIEANAEAYLLTAPLTIARGARLRLDGVELRLLSAPNRVTSIEVRGGKLSVTRSTLTSWEPARGGPDSQPVDGRAFVVARDGARMDVVDSSVKMLGYGEFGRYGITWRGRGTAGRISGSTFQWNYRGAYLHDADGIVIRDSRFEGSLGDGLDVHTSSVAVSIEASSFLGNGGNGLVVAVGSTGIRVEGNQAAGNAHHGILIASGSDGALLKNNRAHDNEKSGISLSGLVGAHLTNNDIFKNRTGVAVQDGARDVRLSGNRIRANRQDGVRISSSTSSATLAGNEVVSNVAAGIFVDDGSVEVGRGNRLASNGSGIEVDDQDPQVRVLGSILEHNQDDGLILRGPTGVALQGNSFRGNGKSAVSFNDPAGNESLLEGNEVGPHPSGPTRLRRPAA